MKKEVIIAKVKARLAAKDKLPGGDGDNKPDKLFDKKQLEVGIREEMEEHTKDKEIAKEIAKDHLSKNPNYYITDKGKQRLKILEQDAENELKKKK